MACLALLFALVLADPKPSPPELPEVPTDWPDEIRIQLNAYAESAERWREAAIADATRDLENATKLKPKTAPDRKLKLELVAEAKEKLANLKSGATFPNAVIFSKNPKAGQVGRLIDMALPDIQPGKVPSKSGGVKNGFQAFYRPNGYSAGTVRQITPKYVFVRMKDSDKIYAFSGLETTDIVDGQEIALTQTWVCTGPQQIDTYFAGRTTMYTFEAFRYQKELDQWKQLRIAASKEAAKK